MKKVSVIMGIYNNESTLAEAIDSILAQTYTDWQMIMCDDGSKDNTYNIANEYVKKYPDKFILIKNDKNLGLNQTLNHCLEYATGEYIARMDGDDISMPTRFEKEIEFLESHTEYSIVSTPMICFDENGDWGLTKAITKPQKSDFLRHSPVHCHAPCMIRRDALVDVGGYTVDDRMLRFEDVNLWYKLYAKGYIGYNLEESLYKMRDNRDAFKRRTLKSRMNGVYVTYKGLQLFKSPWYSYLYIVVDFTKHFIAGIIPEKVYAYIHKARHQ